jgi:hypothetical protein
VVDRAAPAQAIEQTISDTIASANSNEALKIDQETPTSPTQLDISKYGPRSSIQEHLQSIEAAKLNDLAQSVSQEFRKNFISPTIDAPVYTSEYLYSKRIGTNLITCDDSIKTKLKLLATMFGGNVRCRDEDFQKFIDQRLSKGTEDK